MSGVDQGYQPPNFDEQVQPKAKKADSEEFNLLDIDFDDNNAQNESNSASILDDDSLFKDSSDHNEPKDNPKIKEENYMMSKDHHGGEDDEINANSGNQMWKEYNSGDKDIESGANIVKSEKSWTRYFTVDYYKEYFDITTNEVISRLIKALVPLYPGSIFENGKIDLYGPVWIIISLNIAITIFGNMARYVKFDSQDASEKYTTEIKMLTKSVPLITFYFLCMPIALSLLIKISGTEQISKVTFKILSIYGYSFVSFIPATFLYIIPFNSFKWLLLFTAAGMSLFFCAKELIQMVRNSLDDYKIKVCAGIMCFTHFIFILMMKWKFLS